MQERLYYQEVEKMQSLYNVIKNDAVLKQGSKEIVTEFNIAMDVKEEPVKPANVGISLENYENLAKNMIENARRQSEQIKINAYEEAQRLQQEAATKGYEQGYHQGYEKGYAEGQEQGYRETIESAAQQAEEMINNADNLLRSAREEYERYLEKKKEDIKEVIMQIAEKLLQKEVAQVDVLDELIFNSISSEKNAKLFVIKTNAMYCEQIRSQANMWKDQLAFSGDIFVVEDNSVQPGDAVIEKNNGKIVVGIGTGLEKIREVLEGND